MYIYIVRQNGKQHKRTLLIVLDGQKVKFRRSNPQKRDAQTRYLPTKSFCIYFFNIFVLCDIWIINNQNWKSVIVIWKYKKYLNGDVPIIIYQQESIEYNLNSIIFYTQHIICYLIAFLICSSNSKLGRVYVIIVLRRLFICLVLSSSDNKIVKYRRVRGWERCYHFLYFVYILFLYLLLCLDIEEFR